MTNTFKCGCLCELCETGLYFKMGLPDVNLRMRKKRKRRRRRRRGRGGSSGGRTRQCWVSELDSFVLPWDVVALSPLESSILIGPPACLSGFALLDVLQHVGGSYGLMSDSGHGLQSF